MCLIWKKARGLEFNHEQYYNEDHVFAIDRYALQRFAQNLSFNNHFTMNVITIFLADFTILCNWALFNIYFFVVSKITSSQLILPKITHLL